MDLCPSSVVWEGAGQFVLLGEGRGGRMHVVGVDQKVWWGGGQDSKTVKKHTLG